MEPQVGQKVYWRKGGVSIITAIGDNYIAFDEASELFLSSFYAHCYYQESTDSWIPRPFTGDTVMWMNGEVSQIEQITLDDRMNFGDMLLDINTFINGVVPFWWDELKQVWQNGWRKQ